MKKKHVELVAFTFALFCLLCNLGIGHYSSGSAVQDLKEDLIALHGEPYTGREIENGTEDMEFSIESDTFFLTNWNLRNFFGWDYRYKCKVTYTVYSDGEISDVRTITYAGFDPMGYEKSDIRAYIDTESIKGQSTQP